MHFNSQTHQMNDDDDEKIKNYVEHEEMFRVITY